ncbi:Transcription initiation factor TAFII31 [Trinorchestia longiramus]|nr:Transcription initiation factor TAFII31 [Trinorchestia longiramus]
MGKDQKVSVPKEAQVMAAIVKDMNITEYEPGVINQMLEFTYRYVTQVLDDARAFASYAKKAKTIEVEDVKLAVQMQVDRSYTAPPPRDLLLDLARTRNSNPLPPIKPQCGLRLPPDRYCLSACNYKLKKTPRSITRASKAAASAKPSVSMVTTKSGSAQQTVTLVQKQPTAVSTGPPHKIVTVNRPLIKVTSGPPGGVVPKFQVSPGTVMHIKNEDGGTTPTLVPKRKREDE